jgi:hypothetical protein
LEERKRIERERELEERKRIEKEKQKTYTKEDIIQELAYSHAEQKLKQQAQKEAKKFRNKIDSILNSDSEEDDENFLNKNKNNSNNEINERLDNLEISTDMIYSNTEELKEANQTLISGIKNNRDLIYWIAEGIQKFNEKMNDLIDSVNVIIRRSDVLDEDEPVDDSQE